MTTILKGESNVLFVYLYSTFNGDRVIREKIKISQMGIEFDTVFYSL
jgi:hypothetical protein